MKRTLLQIDSCLGVGSTGHITESIGNLAVSEGWNCFIAHGARYVGKSNMCSMQVVTKLGEYLHYVKGLLFDNHGLNSTKETKKIIAKIDAIKPDIIHLHCIHGYYLNYKILFEYLNSLQIPIVWTFHDCWAFTGHCGYFLSSNCYRWKVKCYNCPLKKEYPKALLFDRSTKNQELKKELFLKNKNMVIVPVSYWLESIVKKSFFFNQPNIKIKTIYNGVDLDVFQPSKNTQKIRDKYSLGDTFVLLACATVWDKRKGINDYIKISSLLPPQMKIVLVGVSAKVKATLPPSIIALPRTESLNELRDWYSTADVVLNLSYQETFGLTTVEGFACGTPSIVYNVTASPELLTQETGYICPLGDVDSVLSAINLIKSKGKKFYSKKCRERAELYFDSKKQFLNYISLYKQLLGED